MWSSTHVRKITPWLAWLVNAAFARDVARAVATMSTRCSGRGGVLNNHPLAVCTKRAPVFLSHSICSHQCDHHRSTDRHDWRTVGSRIESSLKTHLCIHARTRVPRIFANSSPARAGPTHAGTERKSVGSESWRKKPRRCPLKSSTAKFRGHLDPSLPLRGSHAEVGMTPRDSSGPLGPRIGRSEVTVS